MSRPSLQELTDSLCAAFPKLDDPQRRLALATYRRLSRGMAASLVEIADDAGIEIEKAQRIFDGWIGVYSDEAKRVIGFWGLTIAKMKHRFEVDGAQLYTWCAWDTLFLPELLEKSARVESVCDATGKPVRLSVSSKRVESADPGLGLHSLAHAGQLALPTRHRPELLPLHPFLPIPKRRRSLDRENAGDLYPVTRRGN
jgi:alkylmercury lyase